ncbi:hypothetical protein GCM10007916_17670 [Psychromonas marina]|uniref:DUF945 family protein n=1 Tax=Psychromonas marina TaxID=88364 RepID=A0ABQ6E032_9GAMM|nr:DUF945 family protein [Psychromonas marina]GLS90700.1 hypothetical protein GCM10007916_17670 [Psychromonas marina]
MKKLPITVLIIAVIYLLMTFFVAEIAEKEIKVALAENQHDDFSVELIDYQRHLFSASAISQVKIPLDQETLLTLNITSTISHFPYQAVINNRIEIADKSLAKRAENYFGTPYWLNSVEKINIFSQLTGQLTILSGKYESDSEVFISEPLQLNYHVDLDTQIGELRLDWAGVTGSTNSTSFALNSLQLISNIGEQLKQSDYDYKLIVDSVEIQQENNYSLLQGAQLTGSSRQGKVEKTIDTSNELLLRAYQFNNGIQQTFTDNRLKLSLTGLYQPAFELLSQGTGSAQDIESALIELVGNGAQLTLSELNSTTPWGEVDGKFDITLDKEAPLIEILVNPYILLDYVSGDLSLALPATLLDEPLLAESLQMGLMTGFLLHNEQTLSLDTSFLLGELIVNGRVIPL